MTRKINLSIRKGSRKIMQDRVRGPETKNLDREINTYENLNIFSLCLDIQDFNF